MTENKNMTCGATGKPCTCDKGCFECPVRAEFVKKFGSYMCADER